MTNYYMVHIGNFFLFIICLARKTRRLISMKFADDIVTERDRNPQCKNSLAMCPYRRNNDSWFSEEK